MSRATVVVHPARQALADAAAARLVVALSTRSRRAAWPTSR